MLDYSIGKPYTEPVRGGNISRKNKKPYKKMKKTLFTLALCAASLIGTASASFDLSLDGGFWTLTGEGSYDECYSLIQEKELTIADIVRLGKVDGAEAKVIFDETSVEYLPSVNTLQFVNATLEFKDIIALHPDPVVGFGPGMMDALDDFTTITPGRLTVSVSTDAIKGWLDEQPSLEEKASFTLVRDAAQIKHNVLSEVKFQLKDGDRIIGLNENYVYQDSLLQEHTYTDAGIVWNEDQLLKNQIALLFVPGGAMSEWGGGGFHVVALGENYIPTPEPTTGTLSLLALAGLAARRRRK